MGFGYKSEGGREGDEERGGLAGVETEDKNERREGERGGERRADDELFRKGTFIIRHEMVLMLEDVDFLVLKILKNIEIHVHTLITLDANGNDN